MRVESIFKNNGINYLTHFTSIYNLKSILNYGICSVEYMKDNNISYKQSDNNRFDNKLNLISVSTNSVNKRMLYSKMKYDKNKINMWIIFILDLKIMDDNSINKYICFGNAASSNNKIYKLNNSCENVLLSFINNENNQKELLFEKNIPINYIKAIVVKDFNDIDFVEEILKSSKIKLPVICKKDMF